MIARTYRFHGYGSLRAVYKRGRTVRGPLMSLKFADRGSERPCRIAVVVSRKVNKSAVVRNRIRRRVYEVCRQHDSDQLKGLDLIITVFSDQLAEIESAKLKAMVTELLQKATRK
jgi:ribonuclease P protein component